MGSMHSVGDGLFARDGGFRALLVTGNSVFEVVEIGERSWRTVGVLGLAEVDHHLACGEAMLLGD